MKTKLFTLLLAVAASVGTLFAEKVQIGDLYYNLDATNQTAEVTSQNSSYPYWSTTITTADITSSVEYNSVTYSVTSIGDWAFYVCTGLTSVIIPNSVTSIGDLAFEGCTGLTSIIIPNSVTSIGVEAFADCSSLTSVTIPNSVTSIEDYVFYNCSSLTSITIPNSVTSIGKRAFYGCTGLTDITIPNSVTTIGDDAFSECSGLTSVTIPNSVTSIGDAAFFECTGLTSVTIPNSVTSIGESAFYNCSSLTSLTIPNSVTSIGEYAFSSCSGLNSIIVESGNTIYDSRNNCNAIIETTTNTLVAGCANSTIPNSVTSIGGAAFSGCTGLTSITIPNSVTSIGNYAFHGCTGLTSVTIPNSVTSIRNNAFAECTGLTSVTIPNSVTSIGKSAFDGCSGLISVTIPNSVTSIGEGAFYQCTGLTSVTIGKSVTSIGDEAFAYCSSLTSITCEAMTPPTCGEYAFEEVPKSIPLYVPFGSEDAYQNATEWKVFTNIQPIKADNVDITTTEVVPDETSVNIAWPKVSGAYTYELVIKDKSGKVVCTLVFDAEGRLLSIAFNAPARDNMPQQTQVAGFAFTVTGLNSGTTYNYSIASKDSNGNTLNTESGSFKTTGESTGLQNVTHQPDETKFIRDGQLFIQRDGKTYSVTGQEVK